MSCKSCKQKAKLTSPSGDVYCSAQCAEKHTGRRVCISAPFVNVHQDDPVIGVFRQEKNLLRAQGMESMEDARDPASQSHYMLHSGLVSLARAVQTIGQQKRSKEGQGGKPKQQKEEKELSDLENLPPEMLVGILKNLYITEWEPFFSVSKTLSDFMEDQFVYLVNQGNYGADELENLLPKLLTLPPNPRVRTFEKLLDYAMTSADQEEIVFITANQDLLTRTLIVQNRIALLKKVINWAPDDDNDVYDVPDLFWVLRKFEHYSNPVDELAKIQPEFLSVYLAYDKGDFTALTYSFLQDEDDQDLNLQHAYEQEQSREELLVSWMYRALYLAYEKTDFNQLVNFLSWRGTDGKFFDISKLQVYVVHANDWSTNPTMIKRELQILTSWRGPNGEFFNLTKMASRTFGARILKKEIEEIDDGVLDVVLAWRGPNGEFVDLREWLRNIDYTGGFQKEKLEKFARWRGPNGEFWDLTQPYTPDFSFLDAFEGDRNTFVTVLHFYFDWRGPNGEFVDLRESTALEDIRRLVVGNRNVMQMSVFAIVLKLFKTWRGPNGEMLNERQVGQAVLSWV